MSLALLFHYLMLNMSRILVHPSSGACDLFVELFHGLYCSGSMCVGVTVWCGIRMQAEACIRIPHRLRGQMVAGVPRTWTDYSLNFFIHAILIYKCRSQIYQIWHNLKGCISSCYVVTPPFILVTKHEQQIFASLPCVWPLRGHVLM